MTTSFRPFVPTFSRKTVPLSENVVINDVLVLTNLNPCSTIEYWKACDEIISKGEL